MKKSSYWFRVIFGKWEGDVFDQENSSIYVEAWDARHATIKALNNSEMEDGEIITGVEYLGYKQI